MDPLSITTSVAGLLVTSGKIVKLIYDLRSTLEDAPLLLTAIASECGTVRTSLSILQRMQQRWLKRTPSSETEDVVEILDTAVTGCALILFVLEEDMQACLKVGKSPGDKNAIKRAKMLLEKDHLQELVTQLRGQQQALGLLISSLQSESIEDIKDNMYDSRDVLYGIARRAKKLYEESDHQSLAPLSRYGESAEVAPSVVTSTRFAFDGDLISSSVYQRTLVYLQMLQSRHHELGGIDGVTPQPDPQADSSVLNDSNGITHDYGVSLAESQGTATPQVSLLVPSILERDAISLSDSDGSQPLADKRDDFSVTKGPQLDDRRTQADQLPDCPRSVFSFVNEGEEIAAKEASVANTRLQPIQVPEMTLDENTPASEKLEERLVRSESAFRSPNPGLRGDSMHVLSYTKFNARFAALESHSMYQHDAAEPIVKRVVFVSDGAAGATAAIVRATNGRFYDPYMPTTSENYSLDVKLGPLHYRLSIEDTAGQEDLDRLRPLQYHSDTRVAVIGFAINNPDSLDNAELKWLREILHFLPKVVIVLAGYKLDLRDHPVTIKELAKTNQHPVTAEEALRVAKRIGDRVYVESSSWTGQGLIELFEVITKCAVLSDWVNPGPSAKRTIWSRRRSILPPRSLSGGSSDFSIPSFDLDMATMFSGKPQPLIQGWAP